MPSRKMTRGLDNSRKAWAVYPLDQHASCSNKRCTRCRKTTACRLLLAKSKSSVSWIRKSMLCSSPASAIMAICSVDSSSTNSRYARAHLPSLSFVLRSLYIVLAALSMASKYSDARAKGVWHESNRCLAAAKSLATGLASGWSSTTSHAAAAYATHSIEISEQRTWLQIYLLQMLTAPLTRLTSSLSKHA